MSDELGPRGFESTPMHYGKPLNYIGSRVEWEGDFEIHTLRYECNCGLYVEVRTKEMDGGPEVVRKRQQEETDDR